MKKRAKKRTIYRDAGTGRIVTRAYAQAHPQTTVSETVAGNEKAVSPKPSATS